MQHVFISYVREDSEKVRHLAHELRKAGITVWLDKEQIQPGQRWRVAIRRAIEEGGCFVACFSEFYLGRNRSYMNEELTLAIDELRQRPIERAWFIPVLFSQNALPDRDIGGGETLRDLQWVDLSGSPTSPEWRRGVQQVAKTVLSSIELFSKEVAQGVLGSIRTAIARRDEHQVKAILNTFSEEIIEASLNEFTANPDAARYDYLMRPVCELYGHLFTRDQVVKLVTRGDQANSRTGFHGLCCLYDAHFEHMRELHLLEVFPDNFQISYFIKLRERHPQKDLLKIVMNTNQAEREIDGAYVDQDDFYDKFMNRGESAFLDAVFTIKSNEDEAKSEQAAG